MSNKLRNTLSAAGRLLTALLICFTSLLQQLTLSTYHLQLSPIYGKQRQATITQQAGLPHSINSQCDTLFLKCRKTTKYMSLSAQGKQHWHSK